MTASTTGTATSASPSLDIDSYLKSLSQKSSDSSNTKTTGSSKLDKDSFMQLMVTQLRYQDPLNPSDNQQMAAQMAQFSQLEALQNLQTSMTSISDTVSKSVSKQVAATEASATASATSLLGQVARLKKDDISFSGGSAAIQVHGTSTSEVAVLNSSGDVVRTISLNATDSSGDSILDSSGDGKVTWDGLNDDGTKAASGTYTLSVRDAVTGKESGYAYEEGTITGVGSSADGTVLQTASGTYSLDDLVHVASSDSSDSSSSGSGSAAAAIALIGHQVRVRDSSGSFSTTGSGTDWTFSAKSGAEGQILDSNGNVVRTFQVSGTDDAGNSIMSSDGTGKFHWNGAEDSGALASDGTYYLQIVSSDGSSVAGVAFQKVSVDQVGFDTSGSPILMSGNKAWSYKNLYTAS